MHLVNLLMFQMVRVSYLYNLLGILFDLSYKLMDNFKFLDEPPYEMQHHYHSHKEHPGNGQGIEAHCNFYRQAGGFHGYHSEAFGQMKSVRMGVSFLDVQGDEDTP